MPWLTRRPNDPVSLAEDRGTAEGEVRTFAETIIHCMDMIRAIIREVVTDGQNEALHALNTECEETISELYAAALIIYRSESNTAEEIRLSTESIWYTSRTKPYLTHLNKLRKLGQAAAPLLSSGGTSVAAQIHDQSLATLFQSSAHLAIAIMTKAATEKPDPAALTREFANKIKNNWFWMQRRNYGPAFLKSYLDSILLTQAQLDLFYPEDPDFDPARLASLPRDPPSSWMDVVLSGLVPGHEAVPPSAAETPSDFTHHVSPSNISVHSTSETSSVGSEHVGA
ncbi:hypothetical protein M231_05825 [Tremella mesenterica]|uniref:Uncharacterized protein n=1 Tax=Tremella mesenterica TaxID=5217 RepID=A0A4Q1BH53_TREME|nr:hypothetical protein M231_05825 [Tremella mesenterica]